VRIQLAGCCRQESSGIRDSPHLHDCLDGFLLVLLGVDFSHGCAVVTKDDSGGFKAELAAQLCGGVVAELVGVPAVRDRRVMSGQAGQLP